MGFVLLCVFNPKLIEACSISGLQSSISACTSPIVLNSYGISPSGGIFSGTGVSLSGGNYIFDPAAALPNSTVIITYIVMGSPSCTTNANIFVVGDVIEIAPNVAKYTYTPGSTTLTIANASYFSDFTWYKNGFVIESCPTCSTLTVTDMGTYTVKATGPCGSPTQDEIEIACDCDYGIFGTPNFYDGRSTPYTFSSTILPGSGGRNSPNIDYIFAGTLIIPQDEAVTVNQANIKMMPGTKIIIQKGASGHYGGSFSLNMSTLSGCDKWWGITIEGESSLDNTSLRHARFIGIDTFEISDAYKALYAYDGGQITMNTVGYFENDENDITMRDYSFYYSPDINKCQIKGKWMHNDISSICGCSPSGYVTPANSSKKHMICLNYMSEINIHDFQFIGNDFLGGGNFQTNGIDIYASDNVNVNNVFFESYSFNSTRYESYFNNAIHGYGLVNVSNWDPTYTLGGNYLFNNYYVDAVLDKAFYFENSSNLTLGSFYGASSDQNRFLGAMNYGTYLKDCDHVYQFGNIFNSLTYSSPSNAGSLINTGLYYENVAPFRAEQNIFTTVENATHFKNCEEGYCLLNYIDDCEYGMQMYGNNLPNDNDIELNTFKNGNYGLILSPTVNPIGANNTDNDVAGSMEVNIKCNLFKDLNYAIVGSGDLNHQGHGSSTNGNKFENNSLWDLCWMDFDLSWFLWYHTSSLGSEPNAGLTPPNLTLNGTSISNATNNVDKFSTGISEDGCFSSLRIANYDMEVQKEISEPKLLTTIVRNELEVSNLTNGMISQLICYDAIGRSYNLELIQSLNGKCKFNTNNLAKGIYYASIENKSMKFYKVTE